MELSRFTDYSIRFLIYAGLHPDELVTVAQASEAYQISAHHLVKVTHKLNKLGYLQATRGRNGGFQLAIDPEEITVGEVVRQTETLDFVECNRPDGGGCSITRACVLRKAIGEARDAFLATLDSYTLADLLKPKRALLKQLSAGASQP